MSELSDNKNRIMGSFVEGENLTALLNSFIENPLKVANSMFEETYFEDRRDWYETLLTKCNNIISDDEAFSKVDTMNGAKIEDLKSKGLYRFRCMVQENLESEYFFCKNKFQYKQVPFTTFLMEDLETDGRFGETVDCHSDLKERKVFHCISVPGENNWVQSGFNDKCVSDSPCKSNRDSIVKAKGNFPLPNMHDSALSCLVKVYHDKWAIKLNEVVEFLGVLYKHENDTSINDADDMENMDLDERYNPYDPPPVPLRLHVVAFRKLPVLNHNPNIASGQESFHKEFKLLSDNKIVLRDGLLKMLRDMLCGDSLAAQYILLNLFSKVFYWDVRDESKGLVVGKLPVNIFGLSMLPEVHQEYFVERFHSLVQGLVPKSYMIESSEHINSSVYTPKKLVTDNGGYLCSALLQLSSQTHLTINETQELSPGCLTSLGKTNKAVLDVLAETQTVKYNIKYFKGSFEHDVPMLVFSEKQSEIKCDVAIPLLPPHTAEKYEESVLSLESLLDNRSLMTITQFRNYISVFKSLEYTIPDAVSSQIEKDFEQSRRQPDGEKYSEEDLSLLLTISRLLTLSYGDSVLTTERWEYARQMERKRKRRIFEWDRVGNRKVLIHYSYD